MTRQVLIAITAAGLAACATSQPITKLVNHQQITTRSVDPEAYEHVSRALLYEEQERWQEAAAELRRALLADSDAPEIQAQLAEVLLRLGKLDEAASAVHASLAIEHTANGLMAQAHVCQAKGDLKGTQGSLRAAAALADFEGAAEIAEQVYLELAEAQIEGLDVPGAGSTLAELCRLAPESATGHFRLMAVAWALGDLRQAQARLREELTTEPNYVEGLAALAWLAAAEGRNRDAIAAFKDALDRSENSPEIAAAFARFLVSMGLTKDAEQLADDQALPATITDLEGLPEHVEIERSARRLDRALDLVARGNRVASSDDAHAKLTLLEASLLKEKGDIQGALGALLGLAKSSPLYLEARLRAAELLRDDGKTAEAARTLEDLPSDKSDDRIEIEKTVALALVEEKAGDSAAASRRLEEAVRRKPDSARLVMALAVVEEKRGNWKRALELTEPLIKAKPSSAEALNFWGFVAADHNHSLDLARARIQAAVALEPGTAGLLDSLGWAHYRAGDMNKAIMFLEQAGRLEPADAEILSHLGELYAKRSENDRAVAAFRKALGLKPEERLRRKLEESLGRVETHSAAGRP